MKLTKRVIDAIKSDPNRDLVFWDDEVHGFGLRVKPTGIRSFIVQYRNGGGDSRRLTLGKYGVLPPDDARKLAKAKLGDVAKGIDPAEERNRQRKAITVQQLCEMYLKAAENGLILGKKSRPKKGSTLYVDRGRITRHVLPLLGRKRVAELTTPDIIRFMRDISAGKTAVDVRTGPRGRAIVEGGAGTASRTVGLLGGILSFAVSEGIIPTNPARGVKRPADRHRDVRLNTEQYQRLGLALTAAESRGENKSAIAAIRLLALTGCRSGEIEGLTRDEVDLAGQCLRLSDSKEGKSVRPLGRAAVLILKDLSGDHRYVLPGSDPNKPYKGLAKAWRRIFAEAELQNISPHGLRHAFASVAADLGYAESTIAALLGHTTRSITGRYVHHLDRVLLDAADKVAGEISTMMCGHRQVAEVVLRDGKPLDAERMQ